jgi:hypothetical protein
MMSDAPPEPAGVRWFPGRREAISPITWPSGLAPLACLEACLEWLTAYALGVLAAISTSTTSCSAGATLCMANSQCEFLESRISVSLP